MPTLLHIDSSPMYGSSVSRELTTIFVTQWHGSHPDGVILERDLNATAIPPVSAGWVGAAYTPVDARTPQQNELLSLSDFLLAELEQADEYVIGVPMHNFGVPSVLKLWIDQICRIGRTFEYADGKPKGLLLDKKANFLIATGGIYDAQTQMASFNYVEPYLRSVIGFLGVKEATFITAGGTKVLSQGHDRQAFLAPYIEAVQTHAQVLKELLYENRFHHCSLSAGAIVRGLWPEQLRQWSDSLRRRRTTCIEWPTQLPITPWPKLKAS